MPDLDLVRRDLLAFSEAVGEPLEPWQAEALSVHAREERETAVVGPRRSGKSRGAALLALHHCYRGPGRHALVVSSSEEGARRLLAEARAVAVGSPLLRGSVADEQSQLLRLSNGSTLRCVAATEAAVRGWTASLVVADEAALVPAPVLVGARPIIASEPGGRFLLISSPARAEGPFFDCVRRADAGSRHVRAFRWRLEDCRWIDPTDVEAARESMSEPRFRAEYEGEFASGADALFGRAALDGVTADVELPPLDQLHPPARLIGGLDPGATHDRSALVAVGRLALPPGERPVFAVVGTKVWRRGHPLTTGDAARPGVAEEVAALPCAWGAFAGEASGLGEAVCGRSGVLWRLMARRPAQAGGARRGPALRLLLEPMTLAEEEAEERRQRRRRMAAAAGAFATEKLSVHPTAESKAAMYSALALLVGRRQLVVPAREEELVRELLTLRVDLSPAGHERVEAPRDATGHADLASALALATLVARGRGGWVSRLAALADARLPEPAAPAPRGPIVRTGAGLELPRRPLIQSVAGSEVTDPDNPATLRDPEEHMPVGFRRPA